MGSQIQILQSAEDEAALNAAISAKFAINCLPRFMKQPLPSYAPLGMLDDQKQVLFFNEWSEEVSEHIQCLSNDPETYHVYPYQNLCIQWNRTQISGSEFEKGRYYLDTASSFPEQSAKDLKKLFSFIKRYIIQNYPALHPGSYPEYAGPHLWKLIQEGKATAVYGNRTPMPLEPNPKYKG